MKTKSKNINQWLSKCCKAEITTKISPDFLGDNPKTMTIGTCNFYCTKCKKPCGVTAKVRLLDATVKNIKKVLKKIKEDS